MRTTHGRCMSDRRLQRKSRGTVLPFILVDLLLRLHGFSAELAVSIFSSDDGGFHPTQAPVLLLGGATKRPARFRILLDPPYVWINAARRRGDIDLCAG